MKLSLLKCSNSNEEEYQSSLQRLEVNVKGEIHRLINAIETLVDSTKSTNEMTSGKPSVVDKETNTAFVEQECFEISNNNTRGSEKFTGKDTKTTAMDTKSLSFVIYETISILNKPRTISVRSEVAILIANKYEVVLLSLN